MNPVFALLVFVVMVSSVGVVLSRSVFRAAYFLAFALVGTAFLYLGMSPLFAAVQILLYTGGVLTLVIFAVMLSGKPELPGRTFHKPVQASVVSFLVLFALMSLFSRLPEPDLMTSISADVFAAYFFRQGALAFETLSLLLLAALFGALAVARKPGGEG